MRTSSKSTRTVSVNIGSSMLIAAICAAQLSVCGSAGAQDVRAISEREIARRQAALPRGEEALARGQLAMKEPNFTLAHEEFRVAVSFLRDAEVSGKARSEAVDGFCESGLNLAQLKIAEGKYVEAESI